ncbi:MAG: hypothetical protein JJ992_18160, partial [Planctomycetes bacterium]|nr:hypothetical protein [Planctomycetota bacterium]
MGLMRFLAPHRERITWETVERSYIAGMDCVPTPARKSWDSEGALRLERDIDESGNLYMPWEVEGFGTLLLSTGSLMERQRPYNLPLELARGTVNRLRTKASVWQLSGLGLPDQLSGEIQACVRSFTRAATSQNQIEKAAALADEAIRQALDAMTSLGGEYSRQVLGFRQQESSPLSTLIVGNLGDEPMPAGVEPMFGAAFNAAVIPLTWKHVEPEPDRPQWTVSDRQLQLCLRHRLKILAGPLLRLDRGSLPVWLVDLCRDFDRLSDCVQRYIIGIVRKYRGQVHLWHCAAATNVPADLPLPDEQRLRLTVRALETLRRA